MCFGDFHTWNLNQQDQALIRFGSPFISPSTVSQSSRPSGRGGGGRGGGDKGGFTRVCGIRQGMGVVVDDGWGGGGFDEGMEG